MANLAKIEAVLDYIRTHPEEHDQNTFAYRNACGTQMCFAGTAVHLSDQYKIVWSGRESAGCVDANGNLESMPDAATEILGLTDQQSFQLFHVARNLDDLERVVKDITNEQVA
jgi:hypothetical protein